MRPLASAEPALVRSPLRMGELIMTRALRRLVVVQPGGLIQVCSEELSPGTAAEVIILVDTSGLDGRPLESLIGAARGGFATRAEADAFIAGERDRWVS